MTKLTRNWRELLPPWSIWLLLALCGLLLWLPASKDALRYDRASVNAGEYWRLVTANLVHSNYIHFLINASSLLLQSILFRGLLRTRDWIMIFIWCSLANILGLHWFTPGLNWYVGMSGALYGTAIVGALSLLLKREWLVGGILTAYLTGRIVYEQNFALTDDLAKWIEVPVAVDAHLWGLVSGYLAAPVITWWWFSRRPSTRSLTSK